MGVSYVPPTMPPRLPRVRGRAVVKFRVLQADHTGKLTATACGATTVPLGLSVTSVLEALEDTLASRGVDIDADAYDLVLKVCCVAGGGGTGLPLRRALRAVRYSWVVVRVAWRVWPWDVWLV